MPPKQARRTAAERIAGLQAEIEKIKARAAQQNVKKDPALRHISGAVRSIDKALSASKDKATRTALSEARTTLSACLALNGALPASSQGALFPRPPALPRPEPERVLEYVRKHPGSRSEEICRELQTDAAGLRPVLHELRDQGKLKVDGKARATKYSAL